MTPARIVPIAVEHIGGFWAALDSVAREQRYLAMLEAPPLDEVTRFVKEGIASATPQMVALADEKIVGWCDVWRKPRAALKHSGILGMGVIDSYRGRAGSTIRAQSACTSSSDSSKKDFAGGTCASMASTRTAT